MSAFLTIAVIHLLGVMSPGPDFAITVRNSIAYSRRTGMWTAVGLGLGILVHTTAALCGVGLLMERSVFLYSIVKYIGAAYLLYIGWKALRSKGHAAHTEHVDHAQKDISVMHAIRTGFLCNVLNPKATLFFLALFTQVIDPATPKLVQAGYGLYMSVATMVWFAFVAITLTIAPVRSRIGKIQTILDKVMGTVLIALGLRVALTRE